MYIAVCVVLIVHAHGLWLVVSMTMLAAERLRHRNGLPSPYIATALLLHCYGIAILKQCSSNAIAMQSGVKGEESRIGQPPHDPYLAWLGGILALPCLLSAEDGGGAVE